MGGHCLRKGTGRIVVVAAAVVVVETLFYEGNT